VKERLITANLAEVTYLLQQRHQLIDASLTMGNLGAEEMLFTLEGENICGDRQLFLGNCRTPLNKIPETLEVIQNLLWKKQEEAVFHD
jgi:hypothetical protein